jgi:uncharacterized protein involved in exopolysaccharide biosynthesis
LASLAGVDLSAGASDQTTVALEVLKSRSFIKAFINIHELLVPIMASKGWKADTDTLEIDSDIYSSASKEWVRDVALPKKPKPSDIEAYGGFLELLNVSQDKTSGLITIAVEFYSPTQAKQWVDWLIADLNDYMRQQDLAEAERTIEYLSEQLDSTAITGMQTIFYQLIEEQTKTIMLAKVRQDYVLEEIDPAIIPEEEVKPKRALICIGITLLGGIFALIYILIRHYATVESVGHSS